MQARHPEQVHEPGAISCDSATVLLRISEKDAKRYVRIGDLEIPL